ncbi:MAG: hypothetical protein WAX69_07655 [Victivallales bacterium]
MVPNLLRRIQPAGWRCPRGPAEKPWRLKFSAEPQAAQSLLEKA